MAWTVKNLPVMQETWVRSLGWADSLEKGMAIHSCILENPMDRANSPDDSDKPPQTQRQCYPGVDCMCGLAGERDCISFSLLLHRHLLNE